MFARFVMLPVVCLCCILNVHAADKDKIEKALDSQTSIEFVDAPLTDVVRYVSEIHAISIDLDPTVNGAIEVTIVSKDKLRTALTELLKKHDLEFVAEKKRLLIRKLTKSASIAPTPEAGASGFIRAETTESFPN